MDKTGDVKCPKCNSNNCSVETKKGITLECKCNECNSKFTVPNTDGVPFIDSK